jgi:UDP-glucuronate 4-epimerase
MPVLVTGAAGFIGSHVVRALRARGDQVIGVDNLNAAYEVGLKHDRLTLVAEDTGFTFHRGDIADTAFTSELAAAYPQISGIVHLAAQAGVRPGPIPPQTYVRSNVLGHLNILELVRRLRRCRHLVYASSSSVYGASTRLPYAEDDRADAPLSLYAATKRADELISHAYSGQLAVPQTGLRFFTVYGPWGRPDMAYFSFARKIRAGLPITLFDGGRLKRDFTYIDDIVAGILGCFDRPPEEREAGAGALRVLNIGNHDTQSVQALVSALEHALGRAAVIEDRPAPVTEVSETFANISALTTLTGVAPTTKLMDGIERFVAWLQGWEGTDRTAPTTR